jgi:hypothetical protein
LFRPLGCLPVGHYDAAPLLRHIPPLALRFLESVKQFVRVILGDNTFRFADALGS